LSGLVGNYISIPCDRLPFPLDVCPVCGHGIKLGRGWGAKTGLYEVEQKNIRRLTPIECERLQGFPDNWTKYGLDNKGRRFNVSDHQRYKCCGNAVTTNVITDIGSKL